MVNTKRFELINTGEEDLEHGLGTLKVIDHSPNLPIERDAFWDTLVTIRAEQIGEGEEPVIDPDPELYPTAYDLAIGEFSTAGVWFNDEKLKK